MESVRVVVNRVTITVNHSKLDDDYEMIFMQTVASNLGIMEEYRNEGSDVHVFVQDSDGSRLVVSLAQLYQRLKRYFTEKKPLSWCEDGTMRLFTENKVPKASKAASGSRNAAAPVSKVRYR